MDYKSLMVAVGLGFEASPRIKLAGSLSESFGARLIGVGAELGFLPTDPYARGADAQVIEAETQRIDRDLKEAEALFRESAGNRAEVHWRSGTEEPTAFLLANARAADLIVVGRQGPDDNSDWRFRVDPADLVMEIGRPILVAPPQVKSLSAASAVVGWKNTREARRAVWDSLPLLRRSEKVFIACAAADPHEEGAFDLKDYLSLHGVAAHVLIRGRHEEPVAGELIRTAEECGADLIVTGAYGHSRFREWVLGGTTRDLLDRSPVCCLMAH